MNNFFLFAFFFLLSIAGYAQYPPQAGVAGSTAIHKSDTAIKGWANTCTVQRGYMDIAQPSLGYVSGGDSSWATGAADNYIVSLGDSGVATLGFAGYITNGPGADFAVFENGFANPNDPEEAFLELAFVEVSSDGTNFFRFKAASHTDTPQVPMAGVYMNARKVHNLAGKYIGSYGTPFDLQELAGTPGLDVGHITHVRLVDVIGSLSDHSSFDDSNRKINDPYPTAIPTGGFDLDAVAVMHGNITTTTVAAAPNISVSVYPNPARERVVVANEAGGKLYWRLTDVTGKVWQQNEVQGQYGEIRLSDYPPGIYYILFRGTNGHQWVEKITRL